MRPGHPPPHPITPLVTGWKIVVGIIAVLTAQNIARRWRTSPSSEP